MKYSEGGRGMEHKHMAKHDGGHMEMSHEAIRKVNMPAEKKKALHSIVTHQEHEEGAHSHYMHHFGSGKSTGKAQMHEHGKD